eukprot:GCRY01006104.1.p1 GENE.GCRY01006104.1~~GCRY01006104.1.p1  ORF type:complete len:226 (-),score=55.06 GCRY01006104.1:46-723(-)
MPPAGPAGTHIVGGEGHLPPQNPYVPPMQGQPHPAQQQRYGNQQRGNQYNRGRYQRRPFDGPDWSDHTGVVTLDSAKEKAKDEEGANAEGKDTAAEAAFEEDFDFTEANEQFKKLDLEDDNKAKEESGSEEKEEPQPEEKSYKKEDFFDSFSSGTGDKNVGRVPLDQQRTMDEDTFGQLTDQERRMYRRGRGRGRGRGGRGRGRGGQQYYNNNNNNNNYYQVYYY